MSTLKTNNVQVGQSVTATNNFTLYQPSSPDGTVRLGVGNSGATTADVLVANSSSAVMIGTATQSTGATLTVNGSIKGTITSGTAQASTSGTSIDFTGIPSWVKRVTVMFSGVSGNGSSSILVQLGTGSTTYTTSGYAATGSYTDTATNLVTSTAGFPIFQNSAASAYSGTMVISNITGNTWVANHSGANGTSYSNNGGGNVALGAVLTAVRITRVNGTDTFDAGSINILYEG